MTLILGAKGVAQDSEESGASGATDVKKTKPSGKQSNVINFEEDVIEGERKNPNLFLQLDMGTPSMDTILYLRNNFNDFHFYDKNRRMIYRKFK